MKVCIVSHFERGEIGGGFISIKTLASALEKIGYEITFAYHPKQISKSDVVLHTNIRYLVETQKICEREKLPLVVVVNSFISCCNGSHITCKDIKYGTTCEKCSLMGAFNCSLLNLRNKYISPKKRFSEFFTFLPRYIIRLKRIRSLNRVKKIVCISPTDKNMLKIAGINEEKIVIIPQPVDPSFLIPPEDLLFNDKVCLFPGGGWVKGFHLAVEAVSKIENVKLAYAGVLRAKNKKIVMNFLGKRAIFLGKISSKLMKNYYYSAHVVLFPSIWFEGYARVFSEAMMCGKPVVAFNNGRGATDYLIHEYNALISDFNVEAYAEQIKRLFEDEALYKKISRNAREYAKKNFLADVVARKYEKVFEEVVKK